MTTLNYLACAGGSAMTGWNSHGADNDIILGPDFFNPPQQVLAGLGVTAQQYQAITLVHEALHSYTEQGDVQLASTLNLGDFSNLQGGATLASEAITKLLAQKCALGGLR